MFLVAHSGETQYILCVDVLSRSGALHVCRSRVGTGPSSVHDFPLHMGGGGGDLDVPQDVTLCIL